jgi:eukaryotic-like serine/threonine-protein kinase
MTPARWRHIQELFDLVVAYEPSQRPFVLAEACAGDPALRQDVVSLLARADQTDGPLEAIVPGAVASLGIAACTSSRRPEFTGTSRFRLQQYLGSGGFGTVYQVWDRERQAVVALKTLPEANAEALYRFKQEFRTLADLTHPNLVTLYELLADGPQWFFTMELIEGVPFHTSHRLGPAGHSENAGAETPAGATTRLAWDHLRALLRQLAAGVEALHVAGKLHRDLKPSNVLVTQEGRVVILDFGLVIEQAPKTIHATPELVGTPAYMAPEQWVRGPVSAASDWYSVGVMLYEALTGRLPFEGEGLEVWTRKQHTEPPAPAALIEGLPDDLNTLCCALLHRDPQARPSGHEVLQRLGIAEAQARGPTMALIASGEDTFFLGRERQLATLTGAFRAMQTGQAVTVYVHGSSGIGKSALLRRFLDTLRSRADVVVLAERCYAQEGVPYKALDPLMDRLSQYLQGLPTHEVQALLPQDWAAVAQLFPVLWPVVERRAEPPRRMEHLDPQEGRRQAFAALREFFARLAARHSIVLCIDDLQWGDGDSAGFLTELLRPPAPPALLFVGCYRTEDAETSPLLRILLPWHARAGSAASVVQVAVEALDPPAARDLAAALLGAADPGRVARADAIAKDAGGHPLFIHELVWDVQGGGLGPLSPPADALSQEDPHAVQEHAPLARQARSVETLIQRRVRQLPEPARRLLEVVAVAGHPLDLAVVFTAAQLPAAELRALALLRGERLIRTRTQADRDELEPYHDRIRETVVAHLSPATIQRYHRRLAFALEASARADPDTVAVHFQEGGELGKAGDYAVVAAEQASGALAFEAAVRCYRMALTLRSGETPEVQALRVRLSDTLTYAGRQAEAAEAYLTAADGADAHERLALQRRAATEFLASGHVRQGLAVLRTVLRTVGLTLPATPRRALLSLLSRRLQLRLRGLRFRPREASQIPASMLLRLDVCWSAAQGLAIITDNARAAALQARHLLLALRAGDTYRVCRALAVEAGYAAMAGGRQRRRRDRVLRTAWALANHLQHPNAQGLLTWVGGMAAFHEGRWQAARQQLEQADVILRERCTEVVWARATARLMVCVGLFFLGEVHELCQRLSQLLEAADVRGDRYAAIDLRMRIAHIGYLAADAPEQARQHVAQAIQCRPPDAHAWQHWWSLIAQLEIALYAGEGPAAWGLLTAQWASLRRSGLLRVQYILIESLYHRACAAVAVAAEQGCPRAVHRELLQLATHAAQRLEREQMPWGQALAQLVRASVAATEGDVEQAMTRLITAEIGFAAADMALHAATARRLRGQLTGGDEGRALVHTADTWMTAQHIRNANCLTAMLAPGAWPSH